ncbi:MAG: substrate-binding domain-containing protein [Proteobacteria bacterium]|nr:substrate-binding domain-containing protein [Pseudomonadota bacterium]
MRRKCLLGFVFLAIVGMYYSFPGIAVADDLIVIGNRSVPASELSPTDIQNIYLGKKKMWDNGVKVEVATLGGGELTDRFLKAYVKKNSSMYNKYWKKQVFTGGGKPPVTFEREKDLVEYVSKTKGAVGYVTSQSYTDSVKILAVMH